MKNLSLYFLRHGQTALTRDNVYCGAGMEPELTAAGHAMARAFADFYKAKSWAAIHVSPQLRTRQTAAPLCAALGVEPALGDGWKEIAYGRWEGLPLLEIERQFPDDYRRWIADPAWHAPTGGELATTVARRALQELEKIRTQHRAGNVLIVSHKATIRVILCALLGIEVGRFRSRLSCPIGSVSIVEFTSRGPLLQALGDRQHLPPELRGLDEA